MAFMHYELTQGNERAAGAKLRQAKTAQDAAAAVSTHYERPADKAGEAAKRGQLALAMLGVCLVPRRLPPGLVQRRLPKRTPLWHLAPRPRAWKPTLGRSRSIRPLRTPTALQRTLASR